MAHHVQVGVVGHPETAVVGVERLLEVEVEGRLLEVEGRQEQDGTGEEAESGREPQELRRFHHQDHEVRVMLCCRNRHQRKKMC